MNIGPSFRADRVIGGKAIVLRCIRPEDAPALRAAFHGLAPESRYQRFLAHLSDLTPPMLAYLTQVDGQDHVAVVALDRDKNLVGVARFIRLRARPDTAEVALTVMDAMQRRGLGAAMFDILGEAARERGIHFFVAHVLWGNAAIRGLLSRASVPVALPDGSLQVSLHALVCVCSYCPSFGCLASSSSVHAASLRLDNDA